MSLRLKMILGIGGIMLAAIVVYAILALRNQAIHLTNLSQREAELIAALTERAVARAMTEGKSEEVRAILEQIGTVPHLTGIRIVDADGTILRSSRPAEEGQVLAPHPRLRAPAWDDTGHTVGIARPIMNHPACYGCHPEGQSTLAYLSVGLSLPSLESQLAQQWTGILLPATLALVAAGGLIAVLFTLVVGRRLETLSHTMSRVEGGDLTAKVPQEGRDELGRLGGHFNAMVARLAEAQRQLEDRHADEIRRADRLASLGKMAAGIAHEINNPLAGMQNCVRTLLKGVGPESQRVQYLGLLQEGLARIGRTVQQLLDFSREARPQLVPTPLAPLLHRCLALIEHELRARKIACALSVDSELPVLGADPHQLEQVFLNILMNALESMPHGGRLTVRAGLVRRGSDRLAEVSFTDTGHGIPPENLPKIFDPFFTTKEVGKGTGLGLPVSYGIVRAHGGFIDVRSQVGNGSTFTVSLPLDREEESHAPADSPGRR